MGSECSPSTRGGPTPGATETGRSSTKVELRSFVPKLLNLPGRTSWPNSPRDLQGGSPSGSERGQARRLVIPRLQRVVKKKPRKTTKKKRKKRRRKRSKLSLHSSPGFLSR